MSEFLSQLASRNLDPEFHALRPRIASRFESLANPNFAPDDETAQTPEASSQQLPSISEWFRPEVPRPSSIDVNAGGQVEASGSLHVPQDTERIQPSVAPAPYVVEARNQGDVLSQNANDNLEQLVSRLDDIDARVSIEKPATETPGRPVDITPTTYVENRNELIEYHDHHHPDVKQVVHETRQNISQFEQHNAVHHHSHPQRPLHTDNPESSEKKGVSINQASDSKERSTKPTPSVAPTTQKIIERHVKQAPTPVVESKGDRQPVAKVPNISVEQNRSQAAEKHTVTVTIGRIEVRGPQKPAAGKPKRSNRPAAKIMSLDDYVKRRSGGAR